MTTGSTGARNGQAATPLLVTATEAATILGVGRTKLYELINRGELRPVHIGRSLRVPVAELERFVDALRAGGSIV
jgi:excisionase family DNA binding protein